MTFYFIKNFFQVKDSLQADFSNILKAGLFFASKKAISFVSIQFAIADLSIDTKEIRCTIQIIRRDLGGLYETESGPFTHEKHDAPHT